MISVGIDVSNGTSTVCILKPCGEFVKKPFLIHHTTDDLFKLTSLVCQLDDDVRIIIEATGVYHLPLLVYLKSNGLFISVVNPYEMKTYSCRGLRRVKTDRHDAIKIASYGIDNWHRLKDYNIVEEIYAELKLLGRRYSHYMKMRIASLLELNHLLDYTMPGIKNLIKSTNELTGKDKLSDFVAEYWHYDNISRLSEEEFIFSYSDWAKNKGYRYSKDKACKIYTLAKSSIPTISSHTPSVKMLLQEAVRILREINSSLRRILTQMQQLAKNLPEYSVVRKMGGVGDLLASKLIAEIGDVRRFHSGKALIAYAGIDAPPYQSGQFIGRERKISKRGSPYLRKIGYEVMRCLKSHAAPEDNAVYDFIMKKELEGKAKRAAKIAGLNKFLRIYYARIMEIY